METFYSKWNIRDPGTQRKLQEIAQMNIVVLLDNSITIDVEEVTIFLQYMIDFVSVNNTSFDLVCVSTPHIYTNLSSTFQLANRRMCSLQPKLSERTRHPCEIPSEEGITGPIEFTNQYPIDTMLNYKLNLIYNTKNYEITRRSLLCILITDGWYIRSPDRLYNTFINRPHYHYAYQSVFCLSNRKLWIQNFQKIDSSSNTGVVFLTDSERYTNLLLRPFMIHKPKQKGSCCCSIL
jgi:hypothetical protein